MTPTLRFSQAVVMLAAVVCLAACAGDRSSPPPRSLVAHTPFEGQARPPAWMRSTRAITTAIHLTPPDARGGDVFGTAVALSRDGLTLAVGADLKASVGPGEVVPAAGSVYVYIRTPQGWQAQARLRAPMPLAGSGFGHSVALSDDGSRLAVGAPFESPAGADAAPAGDQGAVYVFERNASGWSEPSRLQASNAGRADWFGMNLSFDGQGNALAVGAQRHDGAKPQEGRVDSGAVFVFLDNGSGWVEQAVLTASHPREGARLGASLALSGDGLTLAAGAQGSGAVHVFRRKGELWREQAVLTAADATASSPLASQVALSSDGTTLAVAVTATAGTAAHHRTAGSAYVFVNETGQWRQQARLHASSADTGDAHGQRLGLSGDGRVLAISSVNESSAAHRRRGHEGDNRALSAGAVHVYVREGQRWTQSDHVRPSRNRAGDLFGCALALSGDGRALAVGARLQDGAWSLRGWLTGARVQNTGGVHLYSRG